MFSQLVDIKAKQFSTSTVIKALLEYPIKKSNFALIGRLTQLIYLVKNEHMTTDPNAWKNIPMNTWKVAPAGLTLANLEKKDSQNGHQVFSIDVFHKNFSDIIDSSRDASLANNRWLNYVIRYLCLKVVIGGNAFKTGAYEDAAPKEFAKTLKQQILV